MAFALVAGGAIALSSAEAATASGVSGSAEDDAFTIRGSDAIDPAGVSAPSTELSADLVLHNCIPIEFNQLRCYTADPSASEITAVTVDAGTGGAVGAAVLAGAVATEFQRIPLSPSPIVVQPARGSTLVNVDTIVLTSAAPQTHATTVLGTAVTVRATPARFTWDFGDDSRWLTTTDPGSPWPHQSVTHTYRSPGTRTIRLTTEWDGEFQVSGSATWRPITGTATTSQAAPPLEVRSASNTLVATSKAPH